MVSDAALSHKDSEKLSSQTSESEGDSAQQLKSKEPAPLMSSIQQKTAAANEALFEAEGSQELCSHTGTRQPRTALDFKAERKPANTSKRATSASLVRVLSKLTRRVFKLSAAENDATSK